MALITVEIRFKGLPILRVQSQNKAAIVIKGEEYLFYPIILGLPHETQSLSTSLRNLILRSSTPTLIGSTIGEYAASTNGLLGATVQSQVFDGPKPFALTTATAVYREQFIRSSLNARDLTIALSTESQPLKYWTS